MTDNTLAPARKASDISAETIVTGAEFRDFYINHWPKDWYVEDMPLSVEDARGNWVLKDDAEHPLGWFGYPTYQGEAGNGRKQYETIEMHELFVEVMHQSTPEGLVSTPEVLVSFKILETDAKALVAAAEKLGARLI
jgi:hypothetical protein